MLVHPDAVCASLRAFPAGPCHKKPQIAFLNNRIIIVFEFKDMSQ